MNLNSYNTSASYSCKPNSFAILVGLGTITLMYAKGEYLAQTLDHISSSKIRHTDTM